MTSQRRNSGKKSTRSKACRRERLGRADSPDQSHDPNAAAEQQHEPDFPGSRPLDRQGIQDCACCGCRVPGMEIKSVPVGLHYQFGWHRGRLANQERGQGPACIASCRSSQISMCSSPLMNAKRPLCLRPAFSGVHPNRRAVLGLKQKSEAPQIELLQIFRLIDGRIVFQLLVEVVGLHSMFAVNCRLRALVTGDSRL
jgi:hypothetical protein